MIIHLWGSENGFLGWVITPPPFLGICNLTGRYFIPQHNPIETLFRQKKISLSLSNLIPETLLPKVGLMFYQKVLFNRF